MKLALFFTYGVSLKDWIDAGLFDREKELYEEHLKRDHLKKVYWLTYGKDDAILAKKMKEDGCLAMEIEVLSMPSFFYGRLGRFLYSFLMYKIHYSHLKSVNILKTNQMDGAWSAVIIRKFCKKPLIVRTGYILSVFANRLSRFKIKDKFYACLERFVYGQGDMNLVASQYDKQYICSKYKIPEKKVKVLYNYVNTSVFKPLPCEKYDNRIIFIGRLTLQKNLLNLVRAVSKTKFTLDIFGEGELRYKLEREAERLNAKINFMGIVPNKELPQILNHYRYYVLPSFFEGMPKALLEAMACGLLCIGTNITGIKEVIKDGINGYITKGTDVESIRDAIERTTQAPSDLIVKESVQTIHSKFSLVRYVEEEKNIIERLVA